MTVGWLPHYHDMGLIGQILQPIFVGAAAHLMSPSQFLRRPVQWLRLMSEVRATHTVGPDFAFALCTRIVTDEQLAELDLSSIEAIITGAEPVRIQTTGRVHRTLRRGGIPRRGVRSGVRHGRDDAARHGSPRGDPPQAIVVSADGLERDALVPPIDGERAVSLVPCGPPALGMEVAIVDPASSTRVAAGRIGEIWARGTSVAQGYWRRPDETRAEFGAVLPGEPGRPYLRTGDLGALVDGELVITGRIKDLIIIRGRNIYPQDLELAAAGLLSPGCLSAAFELPGGSTEIGLVAEIESAASAQEGARALSATPAPGSVGGVHTPEPRRRPHPQGNAAAHHERQGAARTHPAPPRRTASACRARRGLRGGAGMTGAVLTDALSPVREFDRLLGDPSDPDAVISTARSLELDERSELPAEAIAAADEWGLQRYYVPAEHGGLLTDVLTPLLMVRHLARRDVSPAVIHGKSFLGSVCAWVAGGEIAARMAAITLTGAPVSWGLTEKGRGSDLSRSATSAAIGDEDVRLDGVKWPISNAARGRAITVLARSDERLGPRSLSLVLVDKHEADMSTITYEPKIATHGIRGRRRSPASDSTAPPSPARTSSAHPVKGSNSCSRACSSRGP